MASEIQTLLKDGQRDIWLDSPDDSALPSIIGAGGVKVTASSDGKAVLISLEESPSPQQIIETPAATTRSRNTKYFGCRLTNDREVTVNAGLVYYYEAVFVPGVIARELNKRKSEIGETVITGLQNLDEIYCVVQRGTEVPTSARTSIDSAGDTATFVFQYQVWYFLPTSSVLKVQSGLTLDSTTAFYYRIGTFYADDQGQRVEQLHDGFIDTPLIYHPLAG